MSEEIQDSDKAKKINSNTSVSAYESKWLGRWTRLANEAPSQDHNHASSSSSSLSLNKDAKSDTMIAERCLNVKENRGNHVISFPIFSVSENRDISVSDSSRRPLMLPYRSFLEAKTGLHLSEKDSEVCKESTTSMKLKGKMLSGFFDLFPKQDSRHHREEAGPQPLGSLKGNEKKPRKSDEIESYDVYERNESSTETDILDMDNIQRIHFSDSSPSSSKEKRRRGNESVGPRIEIPDMNQEPPVDSNNRNSRDRLGEAASNSTETQSMNAEQFLSNTNSPKDVKRMRLDNESDSGRWVKRLKPSDLEAVNQDSNESQIKNVTLLHPWVQRWCKNKGAIESHGPAALNDRGESETRKESAFEDAHVKQYPSVAAMAMMGKALSSISPSGLSKKASTFIWDTPNLR